MTKSQRGSVFLIELLIVMSVLLILLAMSLPSVGGIRRGQNQTAIVTVMKAIHDAENFHTKIYADGFRSPGDLAAPRQFPPTCENSGMLDGMAALPQFANYTLTFTFGATPAPLAPGCTVAGFTTFTMTAAPINADNPRSFFLDESLVLRYSDIGPADATSAAWIW